MAQSVNFQINKVESCVTVNYELPSSDVKKLQNNEVGLNSNQVNETHLHNSHVDNQACLFNFGGGQAIGRRVLDDSADSHTRFVRFRTDGRREGASCENSDYRHEGSANTAERNESYYFPQRSTSSSTSPTSESSGFDYMNCRYSPVFDRLRIPRSRYHSYDEHEDNQNLPTSRRNVNVHGRSSLESTEERREFSMRDRRQYYRNPVNQQTRSTESENRHMSGYESDRPSYNIGRANVRDVFFTKDGTDKRKHGSQQSRSTQSKTRGYERERPNYNIGRANMRDDFFREEATENPFLKKRPPGSKNTSPFDNDREMKAEEFEYFTSRYNERKNPTSYF